MKLIVYFLFSVIIIYLFTFLFNPRLNLLNLGNIFDLETTTKITKVISENKQIQTQAPVKPENENDKKSDIQNSNYINSENQTSTINYIIEPAENGLYKMKNAPPEPMSTVEELNEAVNQFRQTHGQGKLEIDSKLCQFADFRAHEISQEFSHDGFSKYIDEGKVNDYGFTNFGENIWQGNMMGVHIVEFGWAKSPGHYAALVGEWNKGCSGIYQNNAVFIFAR